MPRFFRGNESDSDSDYDSASDSGASDAEIQQQKSGATSSRFAQAAFDSDSDDDNVKRVVKSGKEKQLDEITGLSKAILKAVRADEWNEVSSDFEKAAVVAVKISKDSKGQGLPRVYIKCLYELEEATDKGRSKEQLKKLNADVVRSFSKLKQRVRKYNKDFAKQITEYKANPMASEDESGDEAADDQVVPKQRLSAKALVKARAAESSSESESESGSSESGSSESESESDSESGDSWGSKSESETDSETESEGEGEGEGHVRYSRWLKKEPTKKKAEAKKPVKKEKAPQRAGPQPGEEEGDEEDDGFTTVGKGGKAAAKPIITAENLSEQLSSILGSRGRKNTDKKEAVEKLENLLAVAANVLQKAKVLMALVSALFDSSGNVQYTPVDLWHKTQTTINALLSLLEANPQISILESADVAEDSNDFKYAGEPAAVRGSIISFIDRLDDEFTRSLQNIDPHTPEYVERMRDTVPLYVTIVRSQHYFERVALKDSMCRIVLRRLEHLYYRTDQVNAHVEANVAALPGSPVSTIVPSAIAGDMEAVIHSLCTFLYQNAEPLLRTRAMLMHIFSHALHKRYYIARDLLLMSHIQENVHQADVNTQVLYNRAVAQLGLAAFRLGKIQEAFDHTLELVSSGRQRELLAQGVTQQRTQQLSPAEEQLQRQRQLPFHININLELLECVFLTSSMLIEIPYMASANTNPEARRAPVSRLFRRMLDFNERQVFIGPPENTRDHIMAAAKALATGDWESARDYIQDIKIWALLPDSDEIKDILATRIQIEALRTYLFTYSMQFESVGLEELATMFGLSSGKVYSLLARMVYSGELQASIDEVSGVLVFSRANFEVSSRLQQTALTLANKVNTFADVNERMFELKINGGNAPGDRQQAGNDQGHRNQGGERDGRTNQQRGGAGGGGGGRDGQRGGSGGGNQNRKDGGANRGRGNPRRGGGTSGGNGSGGGQRRGGGSGGRR
ncbi:Translation initiation factor 3 subunit c [Coemansia sp. RSA 2399]|nr:Translation initiation factor 3 subunit c [Coemansia sp. RSA 2399]